MSKFISALCTLAALSWMGASSLQAETIYATNQDTNTNTHTFADLFSFDSAAPGVITTPRPITGLNQVLTTLAVRPSDGQLYTEAGGSFYRIDPATAQATLLFTNLALGSIGIPTMAFNPVTGLLRVIGTQGEATTLSFRVNVDTGAVIQDGQSSQPRGLAYTNNYAGAGTTTLYGLAGGYLEMANPANELRFTAVGPLGVPGASSTPISDLSISGLTGTAYALLAFQQPPGPFSSQFYTVNLSTGAATPVGPIGDGTLFVEAIAAPVGPSQVAPVPEPASWALLGAGLLLGGAFRHRRLRSPIFAEDHSQNANGTGQDQ